MPLSLTTLQGERFSFWAESSFGDSSEHYEAFYRIKPNGDGRWQVDILSAQLTADSRQAMSLEWQAFPPLGENPTWLSYPQEAGSLASSEPYTYLAGQLIAAGVADAGACGDGGLLDSGYASQCGLEHTLDRVIEWQNQLDQRIFDIAMGHDLSPQLLKNLIARESQFWPGEYAPSPYEYGLSRITEKGAETVLMWNTDFYNEFCPHVFLAEDCARGYHHLKAIYQNMLIGALASRANLDCPDCEHGVNMDGIDFDIELAAQSLLANGAQVEQIFENLTGDPAGASASYEDLWRFTLVNYNAGAGCLAAALKATVKGSGDLSWANVSGNLVGDCRDAIQYVENIAKE